jgi:hypothetical protein
MQAQVPVDFTWVKMNGGIGYNQNLSMAKDSHGNIYVCGQYASNAMPLGTFTLASVGGYDYYIVKYDTAGNVLWAKSEGGTGDDYANNIAVDDNGNVFVGGGTNSSQITIGNTTFHDHGMLVTKYDSNGNVIWAREGTGPLNSYSWALAVDHSGNVYLSGYYFQQEMQFGSFTSPGLGLYIYLVKYDNNGNVQWVKSSGADQVSSLVTDNAGNVYWNIYTAGGSVTLGNDTVITNPELLYKHTYLLKLSGAGDLIWARTLLSNKQDITNSVAIDNAQNIYMCGGFEGDSLNFGNSTLHNTYITGTSFIAKLDSSGHSIWAKSGTGEAGITNVYIDEANNGYYSGAYFNIPFSFDTTHFPAPYLSQDAFILKFDSSGNMKWAKKYGGIASETTMASVSGDNGTVFFIGRFSGLYTAIGQFTDTILSSTFHSFLVKMQQYPEPLIFCPPIANTSIATGIIAANIQWQADTGTGYTNIIDNLNYSGTNTATLQLNNIPSSWYGYKFRCVFDGHNGNEYAIKFADGWTGAVSNAWENPLNWSCGAVPDQYTDVLINTGSVQINSNVIVGTMTVSPGASVNVSSGYILTILH